MSLVHLVEIDGTRHDITHLEVTEEHRCDDCGQFIKPSEAIVLDGTVTTPDGRTVEITMDFHQNHIYQMGTAVLSAVNDTPPF